MTRYFYTDPLAAAWMASHHGVKLHCPVWQGDGVKKSPSNKPVPLWVFGRIIEACGKQGLSVEPFTVADESLHLFEPHVGDILRLYFYTPEQDEAAGAVMTGFYAGGREAITWFRNPRDGGIEKETHKIDDHHWRIIQRNGQAFHSPESEAA